MAYSGKYRPVNREKYRGNIDKIVWRSTWERKFLVYLDHNTSVIKWASEELVIPYISPKDGKKHRYFTDMWMRYTDGMGNIKETIIEIKPYYQTQRPIKKSRTSKKFRKEVETYAVNRAKWEAATKYAKKNGMNFKILTEKELNIKT